MKFAKELEQELVPEWRIKYLNYKAGKKYIKSISRAIIRANATPRIIGRRTEPTTHDTPSFLPSPFLGRRQTEVTPSGPAEERAQSRHGPVQGPDRRGKAVSIPVARKDPRSFPDSTETSSLTKSPGNEATYGSFVPTPPIPSPLTGGGSKYPFELPGPAIRVPSNTPTSQPRSTDGQEQPLDRLALQRSTSLTVGGLPDGSQTLSKPSSASVKSSARLRRLLSTGAELGKRQSDAKYDYDMQAYDTVRQRTREFFGFLDSELDKVEAFYRQKEQQAGSRLAVLREQLHEMRNRRIEELAEAKRRKEQRETSSSDENNGKDVNQETHHLRWMGPIKTKMFKPGPNSKAFLSMPGTPVYRAEDGRDYVRRPHDDIVPYRSAKRKLKLALQEFYRGLELLKSYTLLNRTAFRKLNKKYDKVVKARPAYRYMNEKVNKAWFVNSDVVDGHIQAVEDLYARYFEKGNHKIAAGKLRRLTRKPSDKSGNAFLTGLFLGTGAVFAIQGLVYGAELLFHPDPVLRTQTSYLMQIYGGYFLMLLLFSIFCIDCYIWTINKINYVFIFEFDPRNNLDWRQLAEFPSFCFLMFGVFIWLNFTRYGSPAMYLYYPVLLIGLTLLLILFPAPVLAYKSRSWFVYSHWRLFFAGLYPVEFRDFFLGDIWSSLTYATCNIELFFCLYANYWSNPVQCNSNHSRLLGFFSTLPSIWRGLQCIRRYIDTKNVFPHLVNCGKYTATMLFYMCLSLYRIHGSTSNLALFITFSIINSIYTSIWDVVMDFSLLQPDSRHVYLRDILALKRRWVYYAIMIVDPILRFSWIFYAIFTHNTQHSSIVSFLVSLGEVCRRGAWALFRVENEHCANVAQYKASRDIPLPYHLEHEPLVERVSTQSAPPSRGEPVAVSAPAPAAGTGAGTATGIDVTAGRPSPRRPTTPALEGLRRRATLGRSDTAATLSTGGTIRKIMAEAHKQDFEKKRRPVDTDRKGRRRDGEDDEDEDEEGLMSDDVEDDDDDDVGSVVDDDERMEARRAERLVRGDLDEEEGSGSG